MKKQSRGFRSRALSGILLAIIFMAFLKIGLTLGNFAIDKDRAKLPSFPAEVLAEDKKEKAQPPVRQKKSTPSVQTSGSLTAQPVNRVSADEMVAHLEQREGELKRKEEQLRQREAYLGQMEQEVEKKLKELTAIQKEIQTYRTEREESQNTRIRSLAKIYGSMKPKEAAKLLENLDDQLVVKVVSTMSPDEAASILGNMELKKAAKISEHLSTR